MDDVLKILWKVREDSTRFADRLADQHQLPNTSEPPVGAFGMCHNWATTTLELANFYLQIWSGPHVVQESIEQIRGENGRRIMEASKSMFVFCLSALEFNIRESTRNHPSVLQLRPDRRQYLKGTMRKSHAVGLIDDSEMRQWGAVAELRNVAVHNNGIADEDLDVSFPDFDISMRKGEMMSGNLKFFPLATCWMIAAYSEWSDRFLRRARSTP